ncbi:MAG: hypothetical protein M0P11_03365 [Anaerolineaceae bacterium]|nr:hypothetical protein [Anaerolineaceae bacterium]
MKDLFRNGLEEAQGFGQARPELSPLGALDGRKSRFDHMHFNFSVTIITTG